jgi:hypothetical protein
MPAGVLYAGGGSGGGPICRGAGARQGKTWLRTAVVNSAGSAACLRCCPIGDRGVFRVGMLFVVKRRWRGPRASWAAPNWAPNEERSGEVRPSEAKDESSRGERRPLRSPMPVEKAMVKRQLEIHCAAVSAGPSRRGHAGLGGVRVVVPKEAQARGRLAAGGGQLGRAALGTYMHGTAMVRLLLLLVLVQVQVQVQTHRNTGRCPPRWWVRGARQQQQRGAWAWQVRRSRGAADGMGWDCEAAEREARCDLCAGGND